MFPINTISPGAVDAAHDFQVVDTLFRGSYNITRIITAGVIATTRAASLSLK